MKALATASPFDAALIDVLDRLRVASSELEHARDATEIAQHAADVALPLMRSAQAVVALGEVGREFERYDRFFARANEDSSRPSESEVAELLVAAGLLPGEEARQSHHSRRPVAGALLRTHAQVIGAIAVSRHDDYSETERLALEVFAAQVATALAGASRTEQTWEGLERAERAEELGLEVLTAVSAHAFKGKNLADFYTRLARTLGDLVGAGRVLFWRLNGASMLAPVAGGHRIEPEFLARLKPTPCAPDRIDLASQVVFHDYVFRASRSDDPPEQVRVLDALGVDSAISVPWRAGEERLGLVAAYDSSRPGGFSREDTWVLQKAALAAGLVTRLWQTQDELRHSVERLTKVDSARQMLLRNMTAVVERERKRFVSELHDDALQKLTAAEMQVARLQVEGEQGDLVQKVRDLLEQTETALRRLVFDVRPPALENPDGLAQSIRDRVEALPAVGITPIVEFDLPPDMSLDLKAMVFRQVAEALGNVERHSEATAVKIVLRVEDGSVHGAITDNGRGFVVAERSNLPGHLGLLGLRERALMAGGRYNIVSVPGEGTKVEFWIPLEQ